MKRLYLFSILLAGLTALSGCVNEETDNEVGTPIAFSGRMETVTAAVGDEFPQTWMAGDTLGVFVYATREVLYEVSESSTASGFKALKADIPASYGTDAYAVYPYCSATSYLQTTVKVPSIQKITGGVNRHVYNMAAKAKVEDGKAEFDFVHMTSVVNLLLSASEEIAVSRLEISAPSPANGQYMAGEARLNLSEALPVLGDVSGGLNTIVVEFDEPMQLGSGTVSVPVAVLPFRTSAGGLNIKVYEERGYPCNLGAVLTEESAVSHSGAISIEAGISASVRLPQINLDMFDMPGGVKVTVKDAKTSQPRGGQKVSVYSVAGGMETFAGEYLTDEAGVFEAELNAGDYICYASYSDGVSEKFNRVEFTVLSGRTAEVEFVMNALVFVDDFSWVNTSVWPNLLPLYADIPGHVANTAATCETGYSAFTDDQKTLVAGKGYEFTSWVFVRPGMVRVGKKNGVGTITFSPFSGISTSDAELNLNVIPWHTVTGGKWLLEYSEIVIKISGGGSFSATDAVDTYNYKILESGGDAAPDKPLILHVPLYGVTKSSTLAISNAKPEESKSTMYRYMIDELSIAEK